MASSQFLEGTYEPPKRQESAQIGGRIQSSQQIRVAPAGKTPSVPPLPIWQKKRPRPEPGPLTTMSLRTTRAADNPDLSGSRPHSHGTAVPES